MNGTLLRTHWLQALDAASGAVDAAARAHTLSPAECGTERARIAVDRAWLATVGWSGRAMSR